MLMLEPESLKYMPGAMLLQDLNYISGCSALFHRYFFMLHLHSYVLNIFGISVLINSLKLYIELLVMATYVIK